MNALIAILITLPVTWFTGLYVSSLTCFADWLDHRSDLKQLRKEYDKQIKLYIEVLERETDDFEKGYWLARIWNLQQERRCLK